MRIPVASVIVSASAVVAAALVDGRDESGSVIGWRDTRQNSGLTVSLEWNRDTGATQIVGEDARDASVIVFGIPSADAADAFRHPYTFIP
jgi:hypothetical protein